MSVIRALFLAFVQSATEFLPVSSSGHLLFFKGVFDIVETPMIFDIIMHGGSLAAILIFYFKPVRSLMNLLVVFFFSQ